MIEVIVILVALVFALNIGASATVPAMSAAYGSGVIRTRTVALVLVGIALVLGAVLAGGPVVDTLGGELVEGTEIPISLALVVLIAAVVPLTAANLMGLPLSTSAVTVGSIVGVGLAASHVNYGLLSVVVGSWLLMPFVAFFLAALISKVVGQRLEERLWTAPNAHLVRLLSLLLIASGVFAAFAAGANNVANAVGPLVNADIVSSKAGLLVGGVVVGLGAVFLGRRVLETGAKRVASLGLVSGTVVNGVSGGLVLVAALMGIPVPIVQSTSAGIMGVGFAHHGRQALQKQVVRDMVTVWVVSPVMSLVAAYLLAHLVVDTALMERPLTYPLVLLGAAVIALTVFLINRHRIGQGVDRAKPVVLRIFTGVLRLF